jgi:signal peptidase I
MDILETITFVGSIFIVIYLFIMGPNQVKGASMDPSFHNGDYILTSKITYKFRPIERGDVIVFKSPKNPDIEFIKRVVAVGGDEIIFRNNRVYINGLELKEDYISSPTTIFENGFMRENVSLTIQEGDIFAMGDNRARSSDSREFGPVPTSSIVGVVFYRYYPPTRMGWIQNPVLQNVQKKRSALIYPSLARF